MNNLIADVFVTVKPTYERIEMTMNSLSSLLFNTQRDQYRLTICIDGPDFMRPSDNAGTYRHAEMWTRFRSHCSLADYILQSQVNHGLGPTINRAVAHICSINDWYSDPRCGVPEKVVPYIVMCQDDIKYSKDWLPVLASRFKAYGMQHKLGFASGIECIEHPMKKDLGGGIILKDWLRATQMLGTREYWASLMPIPMFDPETNHVRAKPNHGMGSGVDWHLIRNHDNSVCKTGRTNLVMPGLCQHMGFASSTWLQNGQEMPESDADKEKLK